MGHPGLWVLNRKATAGSSAALGMTIRGGGKNGNDGFRKVGGKGKGRPRAAF
jgi:hypothetical protein